MKVRRRPWVLLRTKVGEDHTIVLQLRTSNHYKRIKELKIWMGSASRHRYCIFFSTGIIEPQSWGLIPKTHITSQNSVYVSLGLMSRNATIFGSSGREGFACHTYIMFWSKTRDTNIYHNKHGISDINLIAFLFEKGHSVLIYIIVNSPSRPS